MPNIVFIRYAPIWTKLRYQFADLPKVVPWIVLWKNGFRLEIALELWSRRAAQFLRIGTSYRNFSNSASTGATVMFYPSIESSWWAGLNFDVWSYFRPLPVTQIRKNDEISPFYLNKFWLILCESHFVLLNKNLSIVMFFKFTVRNTALNEIA